MCPPNFLLLSVVGLPLGLLAVLRPYQVARIGEIADAVGRKPAGRVEPAGWNVALTRIVGAAFALLGAGAAVACLA
ncbi:hypothetical protein [Halobaculum sp. EA56]|uniref:hypothetical protein n=1 Tax=Halobaculum sp. EA56 TaxID=3421648 RepID=UPI003EBB9375